MNSKCIFFFNYIITIHNSLIFSAFLMSKYCYEFKKLDCYFHDSKKKVL